MKPQKTRQKVIQMTTQMNNKKFLLLINENGLEHFRAVFPGIELLEIQGLEITGGTDYKVLVTPVVPPLPPYAARQLEQSTAPIEQPQENIINNPLEIIEDVVERKRKQRRPKDQNVGI